MSGKHCLEKQGKRGKKLNDERAKRRSKKKLKNSRPDAQKIVTMPQKKRTRFRRSGERKARIKEKKGN